MKDIEDKLSKMNIEELNRVEWIIYRLIQKKVKEMKV